MRGGQIFVRPFFKAGNKMKKYILNSALAPSENEAESNEKEIFIMNLEEFRGFDDNLPHKRAAVHSIEYNKYCKAEFFGSCILGSINLPFKKDRIYQGIKFGFYIRERQLILIGETEKIIPLMGKMRDNQYPEDMSIFEFFCNFLNSFLDKDVEFIQNIEDHLSRLEEALLEGMPSNFYGRIVPYRRDLMVLKAFYSQLVNLGLGMRSNTNKMLSPDDCLNYGNLADRADRLLSYVDSMREYILQIREMYQAQLNVRQTRSMNLLTIISAIFLPLTLLVGWYGMNFKFMPELNFKWGYPMIAILSIVIVAVEIYLFKKKKLL